MNKFIVIHIYKANPTQRMSRETPIYITKKTEKKTSQLMLKNPSNKKPPTNYRTNIRDYRNCINDYHTHSNKPKV